MVRAPEIVWSRPARVVPRAHVRVEWVWHPHARHERRSKWHAHAHPRVRIHHASHWPAPFGAGHHPMRSRWSGSAVKTVEASAARSATRPIKRVRLMMTIIVIMITTVIIIMIIIIAIV